MLSTCTCAPSIGLLLKAIPITETDGPFTTVSLDRGLLVGFNDNLVFFSYDAVAANKYNFLNAHFSLPFVLLNIYFTKWNIKLFI